MLPNGKRAFVAIEKLRLYALNINHNVGGDKARVFRSALGLTEADAERLRDVLLTVAGESDEVEIGEIDEYGQRYTIDFQMLANRKSAIVRSGWIILHHEDFPRLTTCYVL